MKVIHLIDALHLQHRGHSLADCDCADRPAITYMDASGIGLGVIPVIEEGDPPPTDEHYESAAYLNDYEKAVQ